MEYSATAKYIRTSTRKLRLVADAIRRLSPVAAVAQLSIQPKRAGVPLADAIKSAIANATVKNADAKTLRFQTIEVMGGPVLKRWHAVSRGQAHPFKKRMTHIRVVLTDEQKDSKGQIVTGGTR